MVAGQGLVEQQAADRDERGVGRVGRAVFVGHALPGGWAEVAQHQVEGREATDAVAIFDGGNAVVEAGRVAGHDRGHQRFIFVA